MNDAEKKAARREQLRLAKAAQRKRDRAGRRKLDPTASDQITITLPAPEKAILQEIAELLGVSAAEVLLAPLRRHRKRAEALARLKGWAARLEAQG